MCLDANRARCVARLDIYDEIPLGFIIVLATQLRDEWIPVRVMEIHGKNAHSAPSSLQLASVIRLECLLATRLQSFYLYAEQCRAIPHLVYRDPQLSDMLRFIATEPIYEGRVVIHLADPSEFNYGRSQQLMRDFIREACQQFSASERAHFPKDLLLLRDRHERITLKWPRVLPHEPEKSGVRMNGWWTMAAKGDTPLHDCYRQLKGCVWDGWRVRNLHNRKKCLRVMQTSGNTMTSQAVHIQVIGGSG
jgi:hypothetical protein